MVNASCILWPELKIVIVILKLNGFKHFDFNYILFVLIKVYVIPIGLPFTIKLHSKAPRDNHVKFPI